MRTITVIIQDRRSWPYETSQEEVRVFRRECTIARNEEDNPQLFERQLDKTITRVRSLITEDVPFQKTMRIP